MASENEGVEALRDRLAREGSGDPDPWMRQIYGREIARALCEGRITWEAVDRLANAAIGGSVRPIGAMPLEEARDICTDFLADILTAAGITRDEPLAPPPPEPSEDTK